MVSLTDHQFRKPYWGGGGNLKLDMRQRIKITLSFHGKEVLGSSPGPDHSQAAFLIMNIAPETTFLCF